MKPVTNPPIQHIIRTICARAGLPHLAVYTTESSDYNGFAAGPYIGRSLIALTSETLKLPHDALAGVIAHEAVHVKKRDVLTAQLLQFAFIMVISSIIAGVYEAAAHWLETHRAATFLIGWTLIVLLYPAFRSWLVQWMEVRADHLGATLLDGGNDQMANALAILSKIKTKPSSKHIATTSMRRKKTMRRKMHLPRTVLSLSRERTGFHAFPNFNYPPSADVLAHSFAPHDRNRMEHAKTSIMVARLLARIAS